MELDLVGKIAVTAAGVFVGGGLLVWFAKMMATRLIKQYDDRHEAHEKKLEKLSDKFSEHLTSLQIKIAKLEPMVASAISLREDLRVSEGEIAVLEHRVDGLSNDLNLAYNQIRMLAKKAEN